LFLDVELLKELEICPLGHDELFLLDRRIFRQEVRYHVKELFTLLRGER